MRRQSKPFVTEYRSSNRRAKGGSGSQVGLDGKASESEAPRVSWPPAEDDGLNAAHAAADRFFASPGTSSSDRSGASTHAGASGDAGRGRILQAIEEPAPLATEPAEAERADFEQAAYALPKRRGRKPGSKRTAVRSSEHEQTELPVDLDAADLFEDVDGPMAEVASPDRPTAPAQAIPSTSLVSATSLLAASSSRQRRRGERFSWVRTKLRPGERWKRRLPKVAW